MCYAQRHEYFLVAQSGSSLSIYRLDLSGANAHRTSALSLPLGEHNQGVRRVAVRLFCL